MEEEWICEISEQQLEKAINLYLKKLFAAQTDRLRIKTISKGLVGAICNFEKQRSTALTEPKKKKNRRPRRKFRVLSNIVLETS